MFPSRRPYTARDVDWREFVRLLEKEDLLEIATLDKEFAEEALESAREESEVLRARVEEAEAERSVLREIVERAESEEPLQEGSSITYYMRIYLTSWNSWRRREEKNDVIWPF